MTDPLITLAVAKDHLRVTHEHEDDDIVRKSEQATAFVIRYIKASNHGWTSDAVPSDIQAAILLQLEWLWVNRGSQNAPEMAPGLKSLLTLWRTPTLA